MNSNRMSRESSFNLWLGLIGLTLVFGLAALSLYGLFSLLNVFIMFFKSLSPPMATQIIAASGTVLAAVSAVVIGQVITKSREIREAHRNKKTELYSGLLDKIKEVIQQQQQAENMPAEDLIRFFREFNTALTLWGSPGVIRAYPK